MNCPKCAAEIPDNASYCPRCGEAIARAAATAPPPPTGPDVAARRNMVQGVADTRRGGAVEETVLWEGSWSAKAMLGVFVLSGLITVVGIVVAVLIPPAAIPVGIALAALAIFEVGYVLYRRMSIRYRLTTFRFFHERGLLGRVTDRIEVIDIDDVTVEQGLFERMLGIGTIKLASTDRTSPELTLTGIEDAHTVAQKLDNARRAERMRRGLHIETS